MILPIQPNFLDFTIFIIHFQGFLMHGDSLALRVTQSWEQKNKLFMVSVEKDHGENIVYVYFLLTYVLFVLLSFRKSSATRSW